MKIGLSNRIKQLGFDPATYVVDDYDQNTAERRNKYHRRLCPVEIQNPETQVDQDLDQREPSVQEPDQRGI